MFLTVRYINGADLILRGTGAPSPENSNANNTSRHDGNAGKD